MSSLPHSLNNPGVDIGESCYWDDSLKFFLSNLFSTYSQENIPITIVLILKLTVAYTGLALISVKDNRAMVSLYNILRNNFDSIRIAKLRTRPILSTKAWHPLVNKNINPKGTQAELFLFSNVSRFFHQNTGTDQPQLFIRQVKGVEKKTIFQCTLT